MRRTPALALTAVLLVGVAACGGSKATPKAASKVDSLVVLSAAQAKTTAARSAKVHMSVETAIGEQAFTVDGDGVFDFAHQAGRLAMKIPNPQTGTPLVMGMLFDRNSLYMHADLFRSLVGKSWLKIDLKTFRGDASRFGAQDPSSGLAYLGGAKSVSVVDRETVRGEKTTHYFATIDIAVARAKLSGTAAKLFDRGIALIGEKTLPVNVWIDDQGRAVKISMKMTIKASPATQGVGGTSTVSTEFYGWGTPVVVTPPPAATVGDGNALLESFTKGS